MTLDETPFKIKILQPKTGFRFSSDSLLLGKYVHENLDTSPKKILDVGAGVGTVALHAILNRPNDSVTALEIDPFLCQICEKNFKLNSLKNVHKILCEDVASSSLKDQNFDIVMTNPPFYKIGHGRISKSKFQAKHESISLSQWIKFCIKRTKPGGTFYMIHTVDRLQEILSNLHAVGGIEITPVKTDGSKSASRILIKGIKNSKKALALNDPLVISQYMS